MKKGSTAVTPRVRNISRQKLTIGLDLGDRNSWYCVVDEAGRIQLEQRVPTTAKGLREVFGAMACSRIALQTGTHSPWISRLLGVLGHEVIVANARKVRLMGESRKKDDRLDARGGGSGKKRAIVATARKLAVLLHHLWVSGDVYQPLHNRNQMTVAAAA